MPEKQHGKERRQEMNDNQNKYIKHLHVMHAQHIPSSLERLSSFDMKTVCNNLVNEKKYKNVVVMCGAGISVSAGIPDFRSKNTGFKMQKMITICIRVVEKEME